MAFCFALEAFASLSAPASPFAAAAARQRTRHARRLCRRSTRSASRASATSKNRRAASQMLQRAAGLLDGRCERVRGGTFHAFCLETLRRYADRAGYPSRFGVLDQADAADVVDLGP